MKKLISIFGLSFLLGGILYAQDASADKWVDNGVNLLTTGLTGNVGIGASAPTSKLHIAGGGAIMLLERNNLANQNAKLSFSISNAPFANSAANLGIAHGSVSLVASGVGTVTPDMVLSANGTNAQLVIKNGGDIGVGIGGGTPLARLHVRSSTTTGNALSVENSANINVFNVQNDGKVGIGTTNATQALQIGDELVFHDGGTKYIGRNVSYINTSGSYANRTLKANQASSLIALGGDGGIYFETNDKNNLAVGTNIDPLINGTPNPLGMKQRLSIYPNGQVKIGDQTVVSGLHTDYRLAVDGKIVSKEIVVQLSDWADYVFDENYKLASFDEIRNYVANHKHLPNIPSTSEMVKNGLNVSEMTVKQQEKIEELFLYILSLEARIKTIEQEKN